MPMHGEGERRINVVDILRFARGGTVVADYHAVGMLPTVVTQRARYFGTLLSGRLAL